MDKRIYRPDNNKKYYAEMVKNVIAEDWWNPRRILIGFADPERRRNLIENAKMGVADKVEQQNSHLLITFGEGEQRIEYLVLNHQEPQILEIL